MNFLRDPGFLIRIAIAAGYIALSVFLFVRPDILNFLGKQMTYLFSAVILIYGLFRGYRAWQLFQEQQP